MRMFVIRKHIKQDSGYCIHYMGKGKTEMKLINVKVVINQYLYIFLGGDLQVVYGDPLGLGCKQNLLCQKASEFCLIID